MSNMEKLEDMIKNDEPFMEQLKGLGNNTEAVGKLIDEYALKHGIDPEEVDETQLEAVAGGGLLTGLLITAGIALAAKLLGGNITHKS